MPSSPPTLSSLPPGPDRADGEAQFNADAEAFVAALPTFASQLASTIAWVQAAASEVLATATSGDLPSLTGFENQSLVVNAAGNGVTFARMLYADSKYTGHFDDITSNAPLWIGDTVAGGPYDGSFWFCETIQQTTTRKAQRVVKGNGTEVWYRVMAAGVWQSWWQIVDSQNFDSFIEASLMGFASTPAWANVTTSRSAAQDYINNSGRMLAVSVDVESTASGQEADLLVAGGRRAYTRIGNGGAQTLFTLVPPGDTVRLNLITGSISFTKWSEM